jgi:hypothetical protein
MADPAEGYESYMVPTLFAPCARILIQAGDPKTRRACPRCGMWNGGLWLAKWLAAQG